MGGETNVFEFQKKNDEVDDDISLCVYDGDVLCVSFQLYCHVILSHSLSLSLSLSLLYLIVDVVKDY